MAVRVKDRIEANIRQSDKVNNSLSIQLNSGTATVYDGSAAKTVNITPAAIDALKKSGDTMTGTLILGSSTQSTTPNIGIHVHDLRSCTPSQDMFGDKQVNWYFYSVPNYSWRSIMHIKGWNGTYAAWEIAGPATSALDTNFLLRSYYSTSASDWLAILHSGNYTSYTVTKTGSGASGTWGISISGNAATATTCTGNAATATRLLGNGNHTETASGTTANAPSTGMLYSSGLYMTKTYNDSATPVNYGNIINIAGSGTGQLLCEWSGSDNTSGHLYYRSHRDTSTGGWAPWVTILDNDNYSSIADSRYLKLSGGTLTGLLTISTSGKWVVLGCQNESFAHYSTNAGNGHWFNTNVYVQGNIYCGSSYNTKVLTVAGGDITAGFTKPHTGMSWIGVSHGQGAIARITTAPTDGSASCCWAVKTLNGSWGCGNLSNTDNLYFVYGTTANFNSGTNSANSGVYLTSAGVIYGAAWNDYAEFRTTAYAKAGEVVIENGDGTMHRSYERLEPAASIVSDTYGFAIGETEKCGTPIAVAGRVLAYPYEDRYSYKAGDAVCSAPDGKVSKMTREEMVMYPDCIIGYVSEIPEYEVWGQTDVPVNGRIWIKV